MKFVNILVEGQTEDTFVRDVLNAYLHPKDIFLVSIIVKKRRAKGSTPAERGGGGSYQKMENNLRQLLRDSSVAAVTTMFDLYQLPDEFPGQQDTDLPKLHGAKRAEYLEEKWRERFSEYPKFLPYLSVYEFEALLFCDPASIAAQTSGEADKLVEELEKIKASYPTPEDINLVDAPSKRIYALIPEYRKILDGVAIAATIGVDAMRKQCPHFNQWLTKIESL